MNIRKALLLILILAIASFGLMGCKQKNEPAPSEHPATEKVTCSKCGEVAGSEACCMTKAMEETEVAEKKTPADHPGH